MFKRDLIWFRWDSATSGLALMWFSVLENTFFCLSALQHSMNSGMVGGNLWCSLQRLSAWIISASSYPAKASCHSAFANRKKSLFLYKLRQGLPYKAASLKNKRSITALFSSFLFAGKDGVSSAWGCTGFAGFPEMIDRFGCLMMFLMRYMMVFHGGERCNFIVPAMLG